MVKELGITQVSVSRAALKSEKLADENNYDLKKMFWWIPLSRMTFDNGDPLS